MLNFDKDLAREVVLKERRVNGAELKIDRDCENIFALLTPVAVDLRFVLAVLKSIPTSNASATSPKALPNISSCV